MLLDTNRLEHGLLPEAAASQIRSQGIHNAKGDDTFNWSRNDAESERVGVVFIPSLDIESERCYDTSVSDLTKEGMLGNE